MCEVGSDTVKKKRSQRGSVPSGCMLLCALVSWRSNGALKGQWTSEQAGGVGEVILSHNSHHCHCAGTERCMFRDANPWCRTVKTFRPVCMQCSLTSSSACMHLHPAYRPFVPGCGEHSSAAWRQGGRRGGIGKVGGSEVWQKKG